MRKFIFIAGFVLASAAAQAGDRSLSLGGGVETTSAPAAKAIDASKSAEAPQAAEAPRYVERPAVAEPKPETPKAETPGAETSRAETGRSRAARMQAARMQRHDAGNASAGPGRVYGPANGANVEEREAAQHALRDQNAHHQRTAPARHLLVSVRGKSMKRVFALDAPGIHEGRRGWPGIGERKRRRPSDGYARP